METMKRIKDLKISDILSDKKWIKSDDKDGALKQIPKFINAILIGDTGTGKSSYINTCATALKSNGVLVNLSMDQYGGSQSATKKLVLAPLKFNNGDTLMVRLFDCRGICNGIGHKEMEMIIKGHIKPNVKITTATEMEESPEKFRENPSLADEMHCVVYVVRADRSDSWKESLHDIELVRKILTDENIPQCLLLTAIDAAGAPPNDIKNIYKYPCVKHLCEKAAKNFHIPMKYVLPMSNYHSEGTPTNEKDALALHNLWIIVNFGLDHIQKKESRKDIPDGFYD